MKALGTYTYVDEFDSKVVVEYSGKDKKQASMNIDVDFDDLYNYFYSLYYEKYNANPSNLEWEMYQVSTLGDIAGIVEEASRIDAEVVWEMVEIFNSCSVDMQVEIIFSCADVVARHKKNSEENMLARKLIDKLDAV